MIVFVAAFALLTVDINNALALSTTNTFTKYDLLLDFTLSLISPCGFTTYLQANPFTQGLFIAENSEGYHFQEYYVNHVVDEIIL